MFLYANTRHDYESFWNFVSKLNTTFKRFQFGTNTVRLRKYGEFNSQMGHKFIHKKNCYPETISSKYL